MGVQRGPMVIYVAEKIIELNEGLKTGSQEAMMTPEGI